MDPSVASDVKNCLIYSFGINNEWSFDKMFESFGCQVYAFDPSMDMKDGDYTDNPASTATLNGRSLNVQIGSLAVEFGRWLNVQ